MKSILVLALAASLSACATTGSTRIGGSDRTIAAVQSGYDVARDFAGIFLPFLPDAQRARIEALAEAVERALRAARAASSAVDRARAIAAAERATADFRLATGN